MMSCKVSRSHICCCLFIHSFIDFLLNKYDNMDRNKDSYHHKYRGDMHDFSSKYDSDNFT